MQSRNRSSLTRRGFERGLGETVRFVPSFVRAQADDPVRRNASGFRMHNWQDHFDRLGRGITVSGTNSRVMQQWTADGQMFIYPTSVPMTDKLTLRSYIEVVSKDLEPDSTPVGTQVKLI